MFNGNPHISMRGAPRASQQHRTGSHVNASGEPQLRQKVASRLGLQAGASNEQIFAALDTVKAGVAKSRAAKARAAQTKRVAQQQAAADDALYAAAWGNPDSSSTTARSTDDELYAAAWGDD